jgi:hypothetical protein
LQDVLDHFCDGQEDSYLAAGGKAGEPGDPANTPVCAMTQLIFDPKDSTDCSNSSNPGWCYVQGAAAQKLGCPYTIQFTGNMPPPGATTSLQCLETTTSVVADDAGGP